MSKMSVSWGGAGGGAKNTLAGLLHDLCGLLLRLEEGLYAL